MTDQPMTVRRVQDDTGTHIEPPCEDTWDKLTKLRWKAAVVAHDTGLKVEVYVSTTGPAPYGVLTSRSSSAPYDFQGAWDVLTGIETGAHEVIARVRAFCSPEQNTKDLGYLRRSQDVLALLDPPEQP